MDTLPTRRALLRLAGATSLAAALAGAARAEGGIFDMLDLSGEQAEKLAPGQLPFALRTPVHCGEAALRVRDLDAMVEFYRRVIGLAVIERGEAFAILGVGREPLLHLVSRPDAPFERPSEAGLYHIAFLMPSRTDLARWLVHVALMRVRLAGFADHNVSEAIYLDDPEGNGLEVYSDRARTAWNWDRGRVTMGSAPLDIDSIVALTTTERSTYPPPPDRLRIGHMHLRVGDLTLAKACYQQAVGLEPTMELSSSAAFLSSGGYHHHIAMNVWNSAGAGARDPDTTGLDWFSLKVADSAIIEAQARRLTDAGMAVVAIGNGIETADPWGTKLRLVAA